MKFSMLEWWVTWARYRTIAHALISCRGNRTQAARMVGVTRTYLQTLIRTIEEA